MKITFKIDWNGYDTDGTYDLADAEASRLIAAGIARPYAAAIKSETLPASDLTAADVARVRALVSGAGATDAQARAGADLGDELGAVRQISDGENTGTKVRWYQPDNYSAPVWCWDLYPQSVYEG